MSDFTLPSIKEVDQSIYHHLFEHAQDAIILIDPKGQVVIFNLATMKLLGYTHDELNKLNLSDIYAELNDLDRFFKRIKMDNCVTGFEAPVRRKDGSLKYCQLSGSPLIDGRMTFAGYSINIHDISRRHTMEDALRQSEERYRTLFEQSQDVIIITSLNGKVVECNQAALDLFGYSFEEMANLNVDKLYADASQRSAFIEQISSKGAVWGYHAKLKAKDSSLIDGLFSFTVRLAQDGTILGFQGFIQDITEQNRTNQKLLDYQAQLRQLALELSVAEERERRRIGVDMHDQVGVSLAMCQIKLEELSSISPSIYLRESLNDLAALVNLTLEATRSLTFAISSPLLYEVGLEAAVGHLLEQIQEQWGLKTQLIVADRDHLIALNNDLRGLIFRSIRELLVNITKHAEAKQAAVSITGEGANLIITVADDGIGFAPYTEPLSTNNHGCFGLFSIKERLEYLGGNLTIVSSHKQGTSITMKIPF